MDVLNVQKGNYSTNENEQNFAVEVSSVGYIYGNKHAQRQVLFNCDLFLKPGEIVVMTGPSGSGKTTLLTLIGALRELQQGSIRILGHAIGGLSASRLQQLRKHIGFIFQDHNLFESMSASQTLRLAMQLFNERYTKQDKLNLPISMLEDLGLGERVNYLPGDLSTGQKQRVAIGRALINHPQLILADEPTAALDKGSGEKVMSLLRQRADNESATVLIVTHDQRIFDSADRIVQMMDGRII